MKIWLWRLVNRLAWRYDPGGAVLAPYEPRGLMWRASDALHRAAFPGRTVRRR